MITQWEWATPKIYMHDQVSTDKRKPTVNAFGKNYGATEESSDYFQVFDPKTLQPSEIKMPARDKDMESTKSATMAPSEYWGEEPIWDSTVTTHSLMMDERGDVWFTSRVGNADNPAFCKKGSGNPSAEAFPLNQSTRHLAMYDPKTGQTKLIRTCFNTHHVVLGEDANNTVWVELRRTAAGRHWLAGPQDLRRDGR